MSYERFGKREEGAAGLNDRGSAIALQFPSPGGQQTVYFSPYFDSRLSRAQ